MELKIEISFAQLLTLIHQLSQAEKKQLQVELEKFLNQSADDREKRNGFGIWKGKVRMADDFDEPLDDFKEYM